MLETPLDRLPQLQAAALAELATAHSPADLEWWRAKYLGTKTVEGEVRKMMGWIKEVPGPEKKNFGAAAQAANKAINDAYEAKKAGAGATITKPSGPLLDITEPAVAPKLGREHVITQTVRDLTDIFARMGFAVEEGPEVEDERHNFDALNIPRTHPARDPNDNFYITEPFTANPLLLRSQTSTVQIRAMEKIVKDSPANPRLRIVSPGRVYRPDEHDATHYSMFHQIEGLVVDKKVTMSDLKTTLLQFAQAYWGPETEVKLVPSYFPFTEPSAELYVTAQVGGETRWMEVGGCGMIDPAVFEAVGIDPEQWTGFAFGLGVERLAMKKYGIQDIRWLFENDVRFLRQF